MKLEGKVAMVTGTSPNIMGGIAEGLAAEGADLVCIDINPKYAEQCAKSVTDAGRRAISIACDVTDEAQVTAAVAQAKEAFGGVDILVNGATLFNTKGILDMPLDEWRRQTPPSHHGLRNSQVGVSPVSCSYDDSFRLGLGVQINQRQMGVDILRFLTDQ